MPRQDLIELRQGTAAAWTAANPVLDAAEPGYETDTGRLKVGDGSTPWNTKGYFGSESQYSGATVLVAASNSSAAARAAAAYLCTGAQDDVVINEALASLSLGGSVLLAEGDYYCGAGNANYVNLTVSATTLRGQNRYGGAKLHVPAGSTALRAIYVSATNSCMVQDLCVVFDNPSTVTTNGIHTICNEPHLRNIEVQYAGGTAFVIDGPGANIWTGLIEDCTALQAGQGTTTGDGFQITQYAWNCIIRDCFAIGGVGAVNGTLNPTGLITTALSSGTNYTSIAVAGGIQGPISAGDTLVIDSPSQSIGPSTTQVVTASASVATGATSVPVNSFTANANYGAGWSFVVDKTQMTTRYGFNVAGPSLHMENCHGYRCYESALVWTGSADQAVYVVGGEYETCGWCNINLSNVYSSPITGVISYGNVAYAAVRFNSCQWLEVANCWFDGGQGLYALLVAYSSYCTFANILAMDAVAPGGIAAVFTHCSNLSVTGVVTDYYLSGSPSASFAVQSCTASTFYGCQANGQAESVSGNSGVIIRDSPGLTSSPIYNIELATNTSLTADSSVHTLLTTASVPPGTYLVTATITAEFASSSSAFLDVGVVLGTAAGTIYGANAAGMSEANSGMEYFSATGTVCCIVSITTAGTVLLNYYCTGTTEAWATGINHNFGCSTALTLVAI